MAAIEYRVSVKSGWWSSKVIVQKLVPMPYEPYQSETKYHWVDCDEEDISDVVRLLFCE